MTNIYENMNKMLKTAQDKYPISKIMYSSIHHRTDLDDCITINKKIVIKPQNWPAATYSNQMITAKNVLWTQNPRYETVT